MRAPRHHARDARCLRTLNESLMMLLLAADSEAPGACLTVKTRLGPSHAAVLAASACSSSCGSEPDTGSSAAFGRRHTARRYRRRRRRRRHARSTTPVKRDTRQEQLRRTGTPCRCEGSCTPAAAQLGGRPSAALHDDACRQTSSTTSRRSLYDPPRSIRRIPSSDDRERTEHRAPPSTRPAGSRWTEAARALATTRSFWAIGGKQIQYGFNPRHGRRRDRDAGKRRRLRRRVTRARGRRRNFSTRPENGRHGCRLPPGHRRPRLTHASFGGSTEVAAVLLVHRRPTRDSDEGKPRPRDTIKEKERASIRPSLSRALMGRRGYFSAACGNFDGGKRPSSRSRRRRARHSTAAAISGTRPPHSVATTIRGKTRFDRSRSRGSGKIWLL